MDQEISEESFDMEPRILRTSIGVKGKNNPLSNGKMGRILDQLVDEAIVEKQYKLKLNKLYYKNRARSNISSMSRVSSRIYSPARKLKVI